MHIRNKLNEELLSYLLLTKIPNSWKCLFPLGLNYTLNEINSMSMINHVSFCNPILYAFIILYRAICMDKVRKKK